MGYRLTPGERRIIERTQHGDKSHGGSLSDGEPSTSGQEAGTPAADEGSVPLWRSVLAWIGGILLLIALAMFMVWVGSLL